MGSGDVHEPMSAATIGRYRLLKKIAAGGMAEIYLARVTGVGGFAKDVVLKRILPQLAESEQFFRMFLDEARIAATLQHPNVVQVYDAGEADGQYYIAMEHLTGGDLATLRRHLGDRDQRLALQHLVYVVSCVCAGLHYAHEKLDLDGRPLGIVHRDVTPQNIFVTRDGGVKLVDFGIAKASNRLSRTTYGTMKGKLAYMAPEQCQGEDVDRRGDIYALGIVLYELATGENPHRGGAEYAMMKEIVEGTISPPSSLVPDFPPELESIVMKAVAKHPDARYATAREFQLALEKYCRDAQLAVGALTLSDYVVPLLDEITEEVESRSQRFADEVGAYEDYLASRPAPAEPKRRRRAERIAQEDAAAATASIDGLLAELRDEEDEGESTEEARRRLRSGLETVPAPSSTESSPSSSTSAVAARSPQPLELHAPVAIGDVNVRTGSKVVLAIVSVAIGLAGLFIYLWATGKIPVKSASEEPAVTAEVEPPKARVNVPEFGTVVVDSHPDEAAVWRMLGRAGVTNKDRPFTLSVDTSSPLHLLVEHEGYLSQASVIATEDWREVDGKPASSAEIVLIASSEEGARKQKPASWRAPSSDPSESSPGKPIAVRLSVKTQPRGAAVWLFAGKTPGVTIAEVETASSMELRFQRSSYAPRFLEVTEQNYSSDGRATVKPTLAK